MSANVLGGSTVGMGGCLDYELTCWDERLNGSYRVLRDKERAGDVANAGFPRVVP